MNWSVGYVYLGVHQWRVCVRSYGPKMSADQVVPLCFIFFGITNAPPNTPEDMNVRKKWAALVVGGL